MTTTTPLNLPAPPETVTVTVNGQELKLPKGKNLLQALLDVGHYVPHYCYHPSLSVAGNCRLCLIEIEGRPKPEISCNMVVADGLKIKTEGPLVDSCRKGMMEFLLVNHPLDCPICDRGGECMLQRYSMEYGWGTARTIDERRRFKKPQFDPLIDIERNRCIMCTRCTRFCDEVAGDHVMGVFGHGNRNYIGTYGNGPVSSPFSGNVIDLCPVGCLTSKPFRFKARPWEMRQTITTTRVCNGAVTAWTRNGILLRTTPPVRRRHGYYTIDEDTTRFISNEARFGSMHANNSTRIMEPRLRREGDYIKATWEVALDVTAAALRDVAPEQIAFLVGERSTNEEAFLLARLARAVLKTNNIDWRSRFTSDAAARAAGVALAASTGDFELLERKAYASTLMINASLLETAPDIALQIKEAARLGRTKLGLLDTRIEKWFGEHAAAAAIESPEALAGAIRNMAGAIGKDAPEGYAGLHKLLSAEQGLIVLGLDSAGGALNPVLVPAVLELVRALGPGWHFLPVTSARNAKGVALSGGQSDLLPTGRLADAAAREAAMTLWNGAPLVSDGEAIAALPTAPEILRRAANGEFKVLFLHRTDELVTHPQRELVERALRATPTVIAIDVFASWITEFAAVVLPGTMFYETDGSMADIDGTLQRMSQGVRPLGQTQEEWRILEALSSRLGAARRYKAAAEIFTDLLNAWNAPSFKLDDLLLENPGQLSPQVHRLTIGQKTRPAFKLNSGTQPGQVEIKTDANISAAPGQVHLISIHHSQGIDHLGSRSEVFDALRPQPKIEINPETAAALGLEDGDWVVIEGGAAKASQVKINPHMAAWIAFGAQNVLGLRQLANEGGLPAVRLIKTDAPQADPMPDEEEVLLEV